MALAFWLRSPFSRLTNSFTLSGCAFCRNSVVEFYVNWKLSSELKLADYVRWVDAVVELSNGVVGLIGSAFFQCFAIFFDVEQGILVPNHRFVEKLSSL